MNGLAKLLLEIGPLAVFFGTYRLTGNDLFAATAVFMAASVASAAVAWAITRQLPRMMLVVAAVVLMFGGLTLWLDDPDFVKMKPSIVYGLFAAVLGAGLLRGHSVLRLALGEMLSLDPDGWRRLTWRWSLFLLAMAAVNEIVWRTQSEEIWVNVKTFAYVPATMLFMLAQYPLLRRHRAGSTEAGGTEASDARQPRT